MVDRTCACKSIDTYECWDIRYSGHAFCHSIEEIEADGGPCECGCHEFDLDDDDE